MALPVKEDEPPHPVDVRQFGAVAVMAQANDIQSMFKQLWH
jgi:hypothetical protein